MGLKIQRSMFFWMWWHTKVPWSNILLSIYFFFLSFFWRSLKKRLTTVKDILLKQIKCEGSKFLSIQYESGENHISDDFDTVRNSNFHFKSILFHLAKSVNFELFFSLHRLQYKIYNTKFTYSNFLLIFNVKD